MGAKPYFSACYKVFMLFAGRNSKVAQDFGRFAAERAESADKADQKRNRERCGRGFDSGAGHPFERKFHDAADNKIGGHRARGNGENRRCKPNQEIFNRIGCGQLRPRRAKSFQHDRVIDAKALAPRSAITSLPTSVSIASSASFTRTAVTLGKAPPSALITCASSAVVPPSANVSVAMSLCGAPSKMPGEKTSTKLMPRFSQSTARKFAIRAVTLRPSTLTVIVSPTFRSRSCALLLSNETSGSPA